MEYTVQLLKMQVVYDSPVQYYLTGGTEPLLLNEWIGSVVKIAFTGDIHCIHCGRSVNKTFGQGYCYPCFISVPETSECVLRPELCQAHLGISRDMEWSKEHCLQDHFVYLALTSAVKIGVTRSSQIPERWIDQGAWKAIRFARTPNRHTAGLIEVAMKKYLPDKTNWRHMLTDRKSTDLDLREMKTSARQWLPEEFSDYVSDDDSISTFEYPVIAYPSSVHQLTLQNTHTYEGTLAGIRGQYLIFTDGTVFNVRAHQGFIITLTVS